MTQAEVHVVTAEEVGILIEALRLIADPDRVQSLSVARGIAKAALLQEATA